MTLANVINYSPSASEITLAGEIDSASITSVINITKGRDIYVTGRQAIINSVFDGSNTIITISKDLSQDNPLDTLAVRYEPRWNNYATAQQGILAEQALKRNDLIDYSGAVFTSPLTLPNNSRIAGVEHFYQNTKPITRGDGSALVIGDRWWKIDTGTEWFWNGTYWLSKELYSKGIGQYGSYSTSQNNGAFRAAFGMSAPIFLETIESTRYPTIEDNPLNYWSFNPGISVVAYLPTSFANSNRTVLASKITWTPNYAVTGNVLLIPNCSLDKVGNPISITFSFNYYYRRLI